MFVMPCCVYFVKNVKNAKNAKVSKIKMFRWTSNALLTCPLCLYMPVFLRVCAFCASDRYLMRGA